MILSDIKINNYMVNSIKNIKIVFVNDVFVEFSTVTSFDVDLDKVECGIFSFETMLYSNVLHEAYNRGLKVKQVILCVDVTDISDFTDKDVTIIYDCDARIRKLRWVHDAELGNSHTEVMLEGFFNG